jgi:hypothetical protein
MTRTRMSDRAARAGAMISPRRRWLDLTDDQLTYLRAVIARDIRDKRRKLARFTPRPGQDPEEARRKFRRTIEFRERLYADLGGAVDELDTRTGTDADG